VHVVYRKECGFTVAALWLPSCRVGREGGGGAGGERRRRWCREGGRDGRAGGRADGRSVGGGGGGGGEEGERTQIQYSANIREDRRVRPRLIIQNTTNRSIILNTTNRLIRMTGASDLQDAGEHSVRIPINNIYRRGRQRPLVLTFCTNLT